MDVFKAQFTRIQQQLAGLTATQRMLAGSLVAIMVLTIMLWGRYASSSESVAVVDSSFDPAMLVDAEHALKAEGINATVSGDRIMVPGDQQDHAFAVLSYARKLPASTPHAFEDVLKNSNAFDGDEKSQLIFNGAREAQIAEYLQDFPHVAKAQVMINSKLQRRIGEATLMPSGTVHITTTEGADIPHLADSVAYTLIRTVAGMEAKNVSVIINDRPVKVHDPNGGAGGVEDGDLLESIAKYETYYHDKIVENVGFPNPLVSVSVDIEMGTKNETDTAYDPKTSVQLSTSEKTQTDDSTSSNAASEPGVTPNTGMSVGSQSAPGNKTTSDKSETQSQVAIGSKVETRSEGAGKPTVTHASVRLPRSLFLSGYKSKNPTDSDPNEQSLEKFADYELKSAKENVASICGMKDSAQVVASIYYDSPTDVVTAAIGSTASSSALTAATSHIKEIAIGILALISLFMVSMIVRKSGPIATPSLAGVGGMSGPLGGFLDARAAAVGEEDTTPIVGGGRPAMDGVELDEDSYKAQQMVEQVTSMVSENPDAAATLVKRWLSKA